MEKDIMNNVDVQCALIDARIENKKQQRELLAIANQLHMIKVRNGAAQRRQLKKEIDDLKRQKRELRQPRLSNAFVPF